MYREQRIELARETIKILEEGEYSLSSGKKIIIKQDLERSLKTTRLYRPTDFSKLEDDIRSLKLRFEPGIEIRNETTLQAAAKAIESGERVCCLNFASAKNPG